MPPSSKTPESGQALLVNGVSVALDEATREVSERTGLARRGPAREVRAVAAETRLLLSERRNGPISLRVGTVLTQATLADLQNRRRNCANTAGGA
jgi:hypothetical protein